MPTPPRRSKGPGGSRRRAKQVSRQPTNDRRTCAVRLDPGRKIRPGFSIVTRISRLAAGPPRREYEQTTSQCLDAGFARADADDLGQVADEDLAVADVTRARRFHDRIHDVGNDPFGNNNLDMHLGNEVHSVFDPAISLFLPALTAESADFR